MVTYILLYRIEVIQPQKIAKKNRANFGFSKIPIFQCSIKRYLNDRQFKGHRLAEISWYIWSIPEIPAVCDRSRIKLGTSGSFDVYVAYQ